jgi:hypothetical protein
MTYLYRRPFRLSARRRDALLVEAGCDGPIRRPRQRTRRDTAVRERRRPLIWICSGSGKAGGCAASRNTTESLAKQCDTGWNSRDGRTLAGSAFLPFLVRRVALGNSETLGWDMSQWDSSLPCGR